MKGEFTVTIPDPVMVWEVQLRRIGSEYPYQRSWTVQAVVGDVVVFEREYDETRWDDVTDTPITDEDDAKREAARDLGERLKALLDGAA